MNIIFVGSSGVLSFMPLQALINSKHTVCAIAIDEHRHSDISTINSGTLSSFAFHHSILIINLKNDINSVLHDAKKHQPNVIITCCYPRKVPESILSIAKQGAYNLHPSILPSFRGPVPLFWQFHQGVDDFGITLHRMSSEFDSGNIVAKKYLQMPDGVSLQQATELIAESGSRLILAFLEELSKNSIDEVTQNESISSYQSFPTAADYRVSRSWTAKRIYNFIKAYKEKNVFFVCTVAGEEFKFIDALSYQNDTSDMLQGKEYVIEGDEITFSCESGFIKCRIK